MCPVTALSVVFRGKFLDLLKQACDQQYRKLLDLDPALPKSPILLAKDLLLKITGIDLSRCPCCHEGTMIVVGDLPALSISPRWDSS